MEMTRGDFLKTAVAGVGVAVSGLAAFGSNGEQPARLGNLDHLSPAERNRRLAELLDKNAFFKHLNSTFRVSDKSSPTVLDVQLTEVCEGRSSEVCEQFSVLFSGPQEPLLEQSTYQIDHSAMGSFDLFIVPVQSDENGSVYEAVFNRKL